MMGIKVFTAHYFCILVPFLYEMVGRKCTGPGESPLQAHSILACPRVRVIFLHVFIYMHLYINYV